MGFKSGEYGGKKITLHVMQLELKYKINDEVISLFCTPQPVIIPAPFLTYKTIG
jgi:hypothetical protein